MKNNDSVIPIVVCVPRSLTWKNMRYAKYASANTLERVKKNKTVAAVCKLFPTNPLAILTFLCWYYVYWYLLLCCAYTIDLFFRYLFFFFFFYICFFIVMYTPVFYKSSTCKNQILKYDFFVQTLLILIY